MINPRILRRRIRSVQSTAKITKAMEMIATAKMKRSQDQAIAGRPYDQKITQLISDLSSQRTANGALHPLLEQRENIKKITLIHITSNRGLCGGLNSNINRLAASFILEQKVPVNLITVGKKGTEFMFRTHRDIIAEFNNLPDRPRLIDTIPISQIVIDEFARGLTDLAYISYTKFINTFTQKPVIEQLLPVRPAQTTKLESLEFIYEPDPSVVLNGLLPRYVEMKVYHAILEATASEHSARMVAMRNATDNANELIQHLTLLLNKARQEMITTELLDITGVVEILQ